MPFPILPSLFRAPSSPPPSRAPPRPLLCPPRPSPRLPLSPALTIMAYARAAAALRSRTQAFVRGTAAPIGAWDLVHLI
ncbi:hypothetical protein OH77DRAFT_1418941 [Trametes cingulata]|nr:hypothetical protein OH77DRAFT_1418941 [Trametes cingulata]